MLNFYKENGMELIRTPADWPKAIGEVEPQKCSLLKRLKIAVLEGKNLENKLLCYLMCYQTTPHLATGKTLARLLFSRQLCNKVPTIDCIPASIQVDVVSIGDKDTVMKGKGKEYS